MVVLIASTVISCSQALNIVTRLQKVAGLTPAQRIEIHKEISKTITNCPVQIVEDKK